MSNSLFKIVFEGKVLPDHDPDQVKENLAGVFGIQADDVQKLMDRSPDVIRWDADEQTAQKLCSMVQGAGAACHLEPQEAPTGEMVCPACGYRPESMDDPLIKGAGGQGECPACGIIVSRYKKEAAQESKAGGNSPLPAAGAPAPAEKAPVSRPKAPQAAPGGGKKKPKVLRTSADEESGTSIVAKKRPPRKAAPLLMMGIGAAAAGYLVLSWVLEFWPF